MIPKKCKRLAGVDRHSVREKSIRHGHPSTLHLGWARRPLAATPYDLLFLEYLFEQPIVTIRMVEEHLSCAFVTADKVVKRFVKLGLLDEMTGFQRNRRFRYPPYLALFEPPRQATPLSPL